MEEIGLFPLKLVLLPGERVPLHIFEPRYKELIGQCLDGDSPFGLVLADDDGMREIGTQAAIVQVLERFSDGRLNIVIEGGDRFQVVDVSEDRSFETAAVSVIPDSGDYPSSEEFDRCVSAYERVVEAAGAELEGLEVESGSVAYQIAARVDLGLDVKQDLLERVSERERVVHLAHLLEQAAETVRRDRMIHERASQNGRVEFP